MAEQQPQQAKAKPKRMVTIRGKECPVAFSRLNPRNGVIYDYVEKSREVTAFVENESTGLLERRKVISKFYIKKGRAAEETPKGLIPVEV